MKTIKEEITREKFNQAVKQLEEATKDSQAFFKDLSAKDPQVKYGFAKYLRAVAKAEPAWLYPHFDFFVKLLDQDNKIFRWIAIDIIGLLAKVDKQNKVNKQIPTLFDLLKAGNLISASHTMNALATIVTAKPQYIDQVTKELLKVEDYDFDTDECWDIAQGKVIMAIGSYADRLKDKKAVVNYAKRQTKNNRNATKKKAEQFLNKLLKD